MNDKIDYIIYISMLQVEILIYFNCQNASGADPGAQAEEYDRE